MLFWGSYPFGSAHPWDVATKNLSEIPFASPLHRLKKVPCSYFKCSFFKASFVLLHVFHLPLRALMNTSLCNIGSERVISLNGFINVEKTSSPSPS